MDILAVDFVAVGVKTAQFILSFSILVVLHELGHFIPARLFKTRVEKFYLFFNPGFSLWKKKIGETEYGIGWIPFGGYVKIAGMIDESLDKEQMKLPPESWELRSKPAYQRLIVMLGGVFVNVVLAIVIFIGLSFFFKIILEKSRQNDIHLKLVGIKGKLNVVGKQDFKVPRQGMNEGTLFVEINQYLLEHDKTKLKIEVYNGKKLIETSNTSFLSPRSFD